MSKVAKCPECEAYKKVMCCRCDWTWRPTKDDVRVCPNPKCHSMYWDTPREEKAPATEPTA